jgi:hypothetical protein
MPGWLAPWQANAFVQKIKNSPKGRGGSQIAREPRKDGLVWTIYHENKKVKIELTTSILR